MTDTTIQWYLDFIKRELEKLKEGRYTGNIELRINLKDGGIANINSSLNKSVKKPTGG